MRNLAICLIAVGCLMPFTAAARADEKFAGIEVGSRGVKFVMLDVKTVDGVRTAEILPGRGDQDEVKNSGLNDSAAVTQQYSDEAIEATIAAISGFVKTAEAAGVPKENILVVGSSGLKNARNREAFRAKVQEATGHRIEFIKHTDEVALTFLGVCKPDEIATSFSLDIGSGNTKFGYMEPSPDGASWSPHAAQIIWGTGTLRDDVKLQVKFADEQDAAQCAADFADCAERRRGELKIDEALAGRQAEVDLGDRERVYLSGGIVWAAVTILKPGEINNPDVPLTQAEVEQFRELVRKPVDEVFSAERLAGLADADRAKAEKELATVRKVFATPKAPYAVPHADLIAGAELLDAAAKEFDFAGRQVVFPRSALTAWIRSYVQENAKVKIVDAPDEADGAAAADGPLPKAQRQFAEALRQLQATPDDRGRQGAYHDMVRELVLAGAVDEGQDHRFTVAEQAKFRGLVTSALDGSGLSYQDAKAIWNRVRGACFGALTNTAQGNLEAAQLAIVLKCLDSNLDGKVSDHELETAAAHAEGLAADQRLGQLAKARAAVKSLPVE